MFPLTVLALLFFAEPSRWLFWPYFFSRNLPADCFGLTFFRGTFPPTVLDLLFFAEPSRRLFWSYFFSRNIPAGFFGFTFFRGSLNQKLKTEKIWWKQNILYICSGLNKEIFNMRKFIKLIIFFSIIIGFYSCVFDPAPRGLYIKLK